jgi:hypothetical protein
MSRAAMASVCPVTDKPFVTQSTAGQGLGCTDRIANRIEIARPRAGPQHARVSVRVSRPVATEPVAEVWGLTKKGPRRISAPGPSDQPL